VISTATEAESMPSAASATTKSTVTGLSVVWLGAGFKVSSIRKGTAGTKMSPASVR
jgi:hypothetical protein